LRQKHGFTIIELLAAIAIMMIVGGMLLLGGKYMVESSKKTTTKVMLQDLKSMNAAREMSVTATVHRQAINAEYGGVPANALAVGEIMPSRYPTATNAVGHTQNIMKLLYQVPENRTVMAAMPAKQFMKDPSGASYETPIFLDGFKNPIILCPASGLKGVTLNGSAVNITVNGIATSIVAKDGQPFFASAGPDGDFAQGDDNVYSFEQ